MNPLYDAAITADETFSVELSRVFGPRAACDMRYRPDQWPADADLFAAAEAKRAADRVLLNSMRGAL